jgi:hypothetical protein
MPTDQTRTVQTNNQQPAQFRLPYIQYSVTANNITYEQQWNTQLLWTVGTVQALIVTLNSVNCASTDSYCEQCELCNHWQLL